MISTNSWLDAWLVQRARGGDKRAFGKLYDRNVTRVFPLLRRLTGSQEEAEDLTQETFLTAYDSLSAWRGQGAFSTWLCGIATRKYAARRRFAGRSPLTTPYDSDDTPMLAAPTESDPLAHYTRREAEKALSSAIDSLSDSCREAFVLVRVEELSYQAAADLLDIPIGTLQSRLNRATHAVRTRLSVPDSFTADARPVMKTQKDQRHVL